MELFSLESSWKSKTGNLWGAVIIMSAALSISLFSHPDRAAAQSPSEKQFLSESCMEFISKTKQASSPSEKAAEYSGKWVRWTGNVLSVEETLWGIEIGVECSKAGKKPDVTVSSDPSPGIAAGKRISFTGQLDGFSEAGGLLVKGTETKVEIPKSTQPVPVPIIPPSLSRPPEPTPQSPGQHASPSPGGSDTYDSQRAPGDIRALIRSYYGFVQNRQVDHAIELYAAFKRPSVKRNVLEAIAKDTEYYHIDRIEPVTMQQLEARFAVYLWHKKIKAPEEYWEIFIDVVREQGEWRITSTPGKRIR